VIKKKITFSYILEVVEVTVSSELVSSIVGVATSKQDLRVRWVLAGTCMGWRSRGIDSSGNPSLRWRRGCKAAVRTSKHILAFAIAFSLSLNSTLPIIACYYFLLYCKYLLCCNCPLL